MIVTTPNVTAGIFRGHVVDSIVLVVLVIVVVSLVQVTFQVIVTEGNAKTYKEYLW